MKPIIANALVSSALSDILQKYFPESSVYDNPTQEEVILPAWFINFLPGNSINKEIGNRFIRTFHVELVYLLEYDLTDTYDQYRSAAEQLDLVLELFSYSQDGIDYLIRTYERSWKMDLSSMNYEFELKLRVSKQKEAEPIMQEIESMKISVKEGVFINESN